MLSCQTNDIELFNEAEFKKKLNMLFFMAEGSLWLYEHGY